MTSLRAHALLGVGVLLAACGTDTIVAVSKPGVALAPGGSSGPSSPLHTHGSQIEDESGNAVRLTGINWYGLETSAHAPGGLSVRSMSSLLDQIQSLGFNTLRIPFSTELLDPSSKPNGIDYTKSPELTGLDGLGVLDALVRAAAAHGFAVILDRHDLEAGVQGALWYDDKYDEARFISDWRTLASTYRNEPHVVAFDLHNDPHDPATWGDGSPTTDFAAMAVRAGNAVLEENPNLLIVVEGIATVDGNAYWWGGNLRAAGRSPVTLSSPNHVVYATKDYPASVSDQQWFHDVAYPANLPSVWDATWGYLVTGNTAPVYLAEFGSKLETDSDKQWFAALTGYVGAHQLDYTYWCLNPDSADTGGILESDWTTVRADVLRGLTPTLAK